MTRRFWPLVGGTERLLTRLAVELHGRGCPTMVLTARWRPHWPCEILLGDVPVIRLPHTAERGWGNVRYLRGLARWLRQNRDRYDLLCVSQLKHEAGTAVRAAGRGARSTGLVHSDLRRRSRRQR